MERGDLQGARIELLRVEERLAATPSPGGQVRSNLEFLRANLRARVRLLEAEDRAAALAASRERAEASRASEARVAGTPRRL